jgi:uncharacterized protein YxeA
MEFNFWRVSIPCHLQNLLQAVVSVKGVRYEVKFAANHNWKKAAYLRTKLTTEMPATALPMHSVP